MLFARKQVELEIMMLSKISQTGKDKDCMHELYSYPFPQLLCFLDTIRSPEPTCGRLNLRWLQCLAKAVDVLMH